MQQFIDNLIGRLEEEKGKDICDSTLCIDCHQKYKTNSKDDCYKPIQMLVYENAISIVNQLAEEYKGGWIPCSERLPELTEGTEYFKQSDLCLVTEEWWDGDTSIAVGWYNQSGVWSNEATNCKVIAWMPLPSPYQKEGE